MSDFFAALTDPSFAFLRYAVLAGLLSSLAFGVMGAYVVTRRITYIAGAISHCILGGVGPCLYLKYNHGVSWMDPMYGAIAAALTAALIIGAASLYAKEREDTVIGAVWAVGMAVGLLFIGKTQGYVDAMSWFWGNILLISEGDLWWMVGIDVAVLVIVAVFYNRFLAVCFDQEFGSLRGVRVDLYYLLLLCLTALTIVLFVRIVGIIMVIALLTLPAAVAGQFTKRMAPMMGLAVLFCAAFTVGGIGVSYHYELQTGPAIILLAGGVYLVVVLGKRLRLIRGQTTY
jgi:zinc transport system permease protein